MDRSQSFNAKQLWSLHEDSSYRQLSPELIMHAQFQIIAVIGESICSNSCLQHQASGRGRHSFSRREGPSRRRSDQGRRISQVCDIHGGD